MGHRIYDPRLARFLQADPLIEDGSTLNRYTYVHNDPLAWTDPSGYWGRREQRALRTIVAVAITVFTGLEVRALVLAEKTAQAFALAAAGGAVAGGIQSGTVEGAAWGAFSAGVFFGIGQGLAGAKWAEGSFMGTKLSGAGFAVKTVSHGLAGGTISHLQGGKFGHGFVSAAGSAATAPLVDASSANVIRGAVVTTLVGGTLSRISGGNFANGALTAAMSYAFNQVASGVERAARARFQASMREFRSAIEGMVESRWGTADGAATFFADIMQPITNRYGFEIGANIYKDGFGYFVADLTHGQGVDPRTGQSFEVTIPPHGVNGQAIGNIHTHPTSSSFSWEDMRLFVARGRVNHGDFLGYVSMPGGALHRFDAQAHLLAGRPRLTASSASDPRFTRIVRGGN